MNGHLQLSISLKNHREIEDTIKLLQSLLPKQPTLGLFNTTVAVKGDLVKLTTKKPKMLPNDKIIENLMRGAPTAPKHDRVYRDADGEIKVHKGTDAILKEKFRQNALKRKRDSAGHFLPGKKK